MPELERTLAAVQKDSKDLKNRLRRLLMNYDGLYREANKAFREERTVNGGINGLEEFYRLVQTVRRNRDVIGSLMRGIGSLRPMEQFRIIEEDVPEKKEAQEVGPVMIPEAFPEPEDMIN